MKILAVDGEPAPVCLACCENPDRRAKPDANRRSAASRRARMGMLGALCGMGIVAAIWTVFTYFGVSGYYLAAILAPFLVDRFYIRFGGIQDKWRMVVVFLFSLSGILLGNIAGYAIQAFEVYKEASAALETIGESMTDMMGYSSYFDLLSGWIRAFFSLSSILPTSVFVLIGAYACTKTGSFKRGM